MKTHMIETPHGRIAAHESAGQGPAAVLIHGNSSSSRAFSKQLDGPLGTRFRLVALDLPGHGASDDAEGPGALFVQEPCAEPARRNRRRGARGRASRRLEHGRPFGLGARARSAARRAGSSFSARRRSPCRRRWSSPSCPIRRWAPASAETIDRAEAAAYVASFFAPGLRRHSRILRRGRLAHGRAGARRRRR